MLKLGKQIQNEVINNRITMFIWCQIIGRMAKIYKLMAKAWASKCGSKLTSSHHFGVNAIHYELQSINSLFYFGIFFYLWKYLSKSLKPKVKQYFEIYTFNAILHSGAQVRCSAFPTIVSIQYWIVITQIRFL